MKGIAVFDFDWSLIEQDSDYWAIHSLSTDIWQEVLERRGQMQWTDSMDNALKRLQDCGMTKLDIAKNLENIPFSLEMREILVELKRAEIPVVLLSDSNTFYIETILSAYGVKDCVTDIITNQAYEDEQGHLRVQRYIPADGPQHTCTNPCSINICKGIELDKIIQKYGGLEALEKIAYTGDGRNDFCPATRLRETDALFMRQQKGLETYFLKHPEQKLKIISKIIDWQTPKDIRQTLPNFFSSDL